MGHRCVAALKKGAILLGEYTLLHFSVAFSDSGELPPYLLKMEAELLITNFASNLATLAGVLGLYVAYRRCTKCQSRCHTQWCDIESPEVKFERKVEVVKEGLRRFRQDTLRDNKSDEDVTSIEKRSVRPRPRDSISERRGTPRAAAEDGNVRPSSL